MPARTGARATWWVVAGWVAFVVLTLGTSLLGRNVFASTDLLAQYAPWDPGTPYTIQNLLNRDVVDVFLPTWSQIADRLAAGDIPRWSSLSGSGVPLLSSPSYPSAVPTVWPYFVLPLWYAPVIVKVLQLVAATAGMWLLLRRWGTGRPAALLAGLVYASSGFFVSWANFPQASVAAFIPLLLWSVERFVAMLRHVRIQRWSGVGTVAFLSGGAPVALVVACLLFAGFPAVTGWALYAAGGYTLVRVLAPGLTPGRRRQDLAARAVALLGTAFWVGVGVALTAVQLLPFAVQLARTDLDYREGGFTQQLPDVSLITSVLPRVMASAKAPLFAPPDNAIEYNAYLGSAALLLVLLALLAPRPQRMPRGVLSYLAVVSVLCVVLMWFQNPAVTWIGNLPIFSGNPIGRLRSVLFVLLAALAGLGLDALLRGERPRAWRTPAATAMVLFWVVASGVVGYQRFGAVTGYSKAVVDTVVAGVAVLVLGVLAIVGRRLWGGRLLLPVVVALVTTECVLGTGFYWNHVDRATFYPPRASLSFLVAHQGHERTAGTRSTLRPSTPSLYGIRTLGAHAFVPRDWAELLKATALDPGGFFDTATVTQLANGTAAQLAVPGLDRFAVRYATLNQRQAVIGRLQTDVELPGDSAQPQSGRRLTIPVGGSVQAQVNPITARALTVNLLEPTTPAADGAELKVTVRDATGAEVVSGRRYEVGFPAGRLAVPLVEQPTTAPGPWTVTVHWRGPEPLTVAGVAGRPVLDAVVPNGNDGLRVVNTDDGMTTYLRTTALPRFRWASQTLVVPDEQRRAQTVARSPLSAQTVVLGEPGVATSGKPATVQVTQDSGDEVGARVDAKGTGYLVVADSMDPADWTATVDGQETELVVADQAMAAVVVPPGVHQVRIRYTPAGGRSGALLGGAAAVVLLASGVAVMLDRRRQRRPAVRGARAPRSPE